MCRGSIHLRAAGGLALALLLLQVLLPTAVAWRGFCPLRCRCNDDELAVRCDDASLDVIPITLNPGLRELHLSRNNIKNILGSFSVYAQLESLNVSHNQLANLNKNNFHLRHLKRLDLASNFVEQINAETFKGLQNLNELNLHKNSLSTLPARAFHDMRNLEVLDLSQNQLAKLDPATFIGLVRLHKLILRANSFDAIPSEAFAHLSHLHTLDYGANLLPSIPNHAFHFLSRLRELFLDRCGIVSFEANAFSGLVSLVGLHLQYNAIDEFPTASLAELHKLEELTVGGNRFPSLAADDLRVLPSLKKFSLSQSETFRAIAEDAFTRTPNVEQVILENNRLLQHLPDKLFSQLRALKHVSLRGNSLQFIPSRAVPIERLDSLDVSLNPLVCNCSIEWLWNHLRFHETIGNYLNNSSAVRCGGPAHLENEYVKNLSKVDLDCDGPTKRGLLILCIASACLLGVLIAAGVVIWWRRRSHVLLMKTKQLQAACCDGMGGSMLSGSMAGAQLPADLQGYGQHGLQHSHHGHHLHQTAYLTQAHFGAGGLAGTLAGGTNTMVGAGGLAGLQLQQSPYHNGSSGSSYYSSQHTLNSTGYLIANPMDSLVNQHVYMTVGPPSPQHQHQNNSIHSKAPPSPPISQAMNYYTISTTEKKYKPTNAPLAYI